MTNNPWLWALLAVWIGWQFYRIERASSNGHQDTAARLDKILQALHQSTEKQEQLREVGVEANRRLAALEAKLGFLTELAFPTHERIAKGQEIAQRIVRAGYPMLKNKPNKTPEDEAQLAQLEEQFRQEGYAPPVDGLIRPTDVQTS